MTISTSGQTAVLLLNAADAAVFGESELGGKASNLAWLSRNGFRVPDWIVLTTAAFDLQIVHADVANSLKQLPDSWGGDEAKLDAAAESIRQRLCDAPLHPELAAALAKAVGDSAEFFAVRSSAVGEDSAAASFAGQLDSFMFRKGLAAIEEAVRRCFASAFNVRAVRYRLRHGMDIGATRAAVIVQKMIEGEVSGVCFTAHPISGRRDHALISAAYGSGEGIVSGHCVTDEFTLPLYGESIEKIVNDKDVALVFDRQAGQGLTEMSVESGKRNVACLADDQVRALRDMTRAIAERLGSPQDIEWTFAGGQFHILQTRPITSLPLPQKPKGNRIVWDNSNIQESYCGVTTPLTFSFARRAYAQVYEQTLRLTGPSPQLVEEYRPALENLLGLVRGRIYYNINNWYRGLLLLPSFKTNKADMERMMGLQDPVDFVDPPAVGLIDKLRKVPRVARTLLTLMSAFRRIDRLAADFLAHFNAVYRATERRRFHQMELGELIAQTHSLRAQLLNRWQPPILNDFFVMMMNGRVARRLEGSGVENPALVQNKLMAGEEGIESTEPTKELIRCCAVIRNDPVLIDAFARIGNDRLMDHLQVRAPAFYQRCQDYIERYGDRTMGELKLETITLRQNPTFLFVMMRNLMGRPDLSPEGLDATEKALRGEAEQQAWAAVRKRYGGWGLNRFRRDVTRLRAAVRNRENMRLARTRLFGLFRDLYLEIGKQMAMHGLLAEARDVFYLTVEEIEAFDEGRAAQTDLKSLTAARKAEFAGYEAADIAHHFITHGLVHLGNDFTYPYATSAPDPDAERLTGLGCYPGVVEQELRLIFSPDDVHDLAGRILCTVRTDPGWAPLFPSAGGILVERGSTLSHSAVVARELGIPAIVNVPGLTSIVRDGERVRMDGSSGVVLRLDRTDTAA